MLSPANDYHMVRRKPNGVSIIPPEKVNLELGSELIYVTNITNHICGEKIVMWRKFGKIWEILPQYTRFHVEKN